MIHIQEYAAQWQALQDFLQAHSSTQALALAFSGGLDSRFVAHAAQKAGVALTLFHASGVHVPRAESHFARQWAQERAFTLKIFPLEVCDLPHVYNNSEQRCYHCKKHLLHVFMTAAQAQGLALCDGTNADDLQAHRPGLRALQEYKVLSPLAQCGITKHVVRALAASTGLEQAQQKASPCLLTRLPYGAVVDSQLLQSIDAAEEALHQAGVPECRLRICPQPLLQVTKVCPLTEAQMQDILTKHGFTEAAIVHEDILSGYFDRK